MNVILRALGPQNEDDTSFLTGDYGIYYIKRLEGNARRPPANSLEPSVDQDATGLVGTFTRLRQFLSKPTGALVTILANLMKLNPYFRWTAFECLQNKVFDPYRDANKERILSEMQRKRHHDDAFPGQRLASQVKGHQLLLDVDEANAFDYKRGTNTKYTLDEIKAEVIKEISGFEAQNTNLRGAVLTDRFH